MPSEYGALIAAGVIIASFAVGSLVSSMIGWTFRLFFPMIWKFPWPKPVPPEYDSPKYTNNDRGTTVLMAGSFNPPHKGHAEMIQYLSSRYQKVLVVVGHNPDKEYDVSPEDRVGLLETCFGHLDNVSISSTSDYIWRHAPEAKLFFRGIRTWQKDGADERKLYFQNTWGPIAFGPFWWPRETYFLEGNPSYTHVSSTLVRELCGKATASTGSKKGGGKGKDPLKEILPEKIVGKVKELYSKSKKSD